MYGMTEAMQRGAMQGSMAKNHTRAMWVMLSIMSIIHVIDLGDLKCKFNWVSFVPSPTLCSAYYSAFDMQLKGHNAQPIILQRYSELFVYIARIMLNGNG